MDDSILELVLSIQSDASRKEAQGLVERFGGVLSSIQDEAGLTTRLPKPLSDYYFVRNLKHEELVSLADAVSSIDSFDAAYLAPVAKVAAFAQDRPMIDLLPGDLPRDLTVLQGHLLDSASGGVDAHHAWDNEAKGAGVTLIDIEGGWNFDHEDLKDNNLGLISGTNGPASDVDHGTKAIGVISADENSFGVTGIAPQAQTGGVSIYPTQSSAPAIIKAADRLQAGDIILLELQRSHPTSGLTMGNGPDIPIEWWPCDLAAVEFAVKKGIVVVSCAGNAGQDLDDPIFNSPAPRFPLGWSNPFSRRDELSSIIVGAGVPPRSRFGRDRSRLPSSNFGGCVTCQGWGAFVLSTGGGDVRFTPNPNQRYTKNFSGTSSAAAMIAGVVACMQSFRIRKNSHPLAPSDIKLLLEEFGSPQQSSGDRPRTQNVGKRPDLRLLLDSLERMS